MSMACLSSAPYGARRNCSCTIAHVLRFRISICGGGWISGLFRLLSSVAVTLWTSFHCALDQAYNLFVEAFRDLPRFCAVINGQQARQGVIAHIHVATELIDEDRYRRIGSGCRHALSHTAHDHWISSNDPNHPIGMAQRSHSQCRT